MNREWIDDAVCEILMRDGPDRHVDGHGVLTDFIEALLEGRGAAWLRRYQGRASEDEDALREGLARFERAARGLLDFYDNTKNEPVTNHAMHVSALRAALRDTSLHGEKPHR